MKKRTIGSVMVVAMLLAVSLYFVGGTYARYTGEFTGNATVSVAKWAVQVNDSDETSLTLDFKREENTNVLEGKIAPGTKLSADAEIDLTGTEVAVELIAEVSESDLTSKLEQLGIDKESLKVTVSTDGTGNTVTTASGDGSTSSPFVINLPEGAAFSAEDGVVGLKVTIEWENVEDNNATDTAAGKNAASDVKIPVKITVRQHIDA